MAHLPPPHQGEFIGNILVESNEIAGTFGSGVTFDIYRSYNY